MKLTEIYEGVLITDTGFGRAVREYLTDIDSWAEKYDISDSLRSVIKKFWLDCVDYIIGDDFLFDVDSGDCLFPGESDADEIFYLTLLTDIYDVIVGLDSFCRTLGFIDAVKAHSEMLIEIRKNWDSIQRWEDEVFAKEIFVKTLNNLSDNNFDFLLKEKYYDDEEDN